VHMKKMELQFEITESAKEKIQEDIAQCDFEDPVTVLTYLRTDSDPEPTWKIGWAPRSNVAERLFVLSGVEIVVAFDEWLELLDGKSLTLVDGYYKLVDVI